jgi:nucleoside-diphosphate-sugar epimerase
MSNENDMETAISRCDRVVHLAHGGGGGTWEQIKASMVDGTRLIGELCVKHGIKKLVYVGSIASLYLGNKHDTIRGSTPNDPLAATKRPDYSRGKALSEDVLMELHLQHNLPVCILRPGIVVGDGGVPFHSGLGIFNQDRYCIGWNKGTNPLPFVLVDDVAQAIILALDKEGTEGKAYNVVGDVLLTGKEYIEALASALGRDLHYLPQSPIKTQLIEVGKWAIKIGLQKRKAPFPSYRDLLSRGMVASFDSTDIKHDLGWQPENNYDAFVERGIKIYAR